MAKQPRGEGEEEIDKGGREKVIDEGGEEIRRERGMGRGMGEGRKENCGFLIFSLSLVAKRSHVLHNM